MRLHVSEPDLSGNEHAYVLEALQSSWISSTGPFVQRFEQDFAQRCSRQHALSVCNGTAGLHLAMLALGVGPGDEVIVPSMSFVATANAAKYVGATPVFVDVHHDTWCMDTAAVAEAITDRTKGIIAVDLYGHMPNLYELEDLASSHGIWLVEDAAEAHGAMLGHRVAGAFGKASVFSFYGNKILTCGEGGAVVTDDDELAKKMKLIRGQGMYPLPPHQRRYWHSMVGHNFRLTNLACAILCAQLERFDDMMGARWLLASRYRSNLSAREKITLRVDHPSVMAAPWVQPVLFEDVQLREAAEECLAAQGVETRPFFYPLHRLPAYRSSVWRGQGRFPVTIDISDRGLCLPLHTKMTANDVDFVCELLGSIT